MLDLSSNELVDRLAVILTQESGSQLLGIPKADSGKGYAMAEAVYSQISDWGVIDDIVATSFDTTLSNTGPENGAIAKLENMLHRKLLKLACRHHIYEIILRSVFDLKLGATSAPEVPIFQRFRKDWAKIDQTKFQTGINDAKVKEIVDVVKVDVVNFCENELKKGTFRDDYKELLELTLIFLGQKEGVIKFRPPGAIHHARWMAKAIYSLKIFMFSSQFHLTTKELNALRDICLFIVKFYVKIWFQCTKPLQAPRLDLQFMKDIKAYASVDKETSSVVLNKLRTQSWYLAEETIALAFFDNNVTVEEKQQMVQTLKTQSKPNEDTRIFRLIIPELQMRNINEWHLNNFITENTVNFFTRFNISISFLEIHPSEWYTNQEYIRAQNLLKCLQVTNDHAERGIYLIKRFNRKMTTNENDLQCLLQLISKLEKEDSGITKSALTRK